MLRRMLVIVLGVLIVSACSTSRSASVKAEVRGLTAEVRDSSRVEQVMVAVHDTIVETTAIIIRENENGDTLRVSRVTERDRIRSRADVRSMKEEVKVVRDTVYVERRDSVRVETPRQARGDIGRALALSYLKWIFWILVSVTVLLIVIKMFNLFKV